jgi:hypothetical protein
MATSVQPRSRLQSPPRLRLLHSSAVPSRAFSFDSAVPVSTIELFLLLEAIQAAECNGPGAS